MLQRKKPAKLAWTQAWRRAHKKGLQETTARKRSRKTTKVARAVVGISLDEIRKKAAQKPEFRTAQREAALKEAKQKKKTTQKKGKTTYSASSAMKAQKHMGGKGSRGGSQR